MKSRIFAFSLGAMLFLLSTFSVFAQNIDQSNINSWLENYGNGNPNYAIVTTTVKVSLSYHILTGPYALSQVYADFNQFQGPANTNMVFNAMDGLWHAQYFILPGTLVNASARVIIHATYVNGGSTTMPDDVVFTVNNIPQPCLVNVASDPAGANAFRDGVLIGQTPCSFTLEYGSTALVSVSYPPYVFVPDSQLVEWHYYPQTVSFTGSFPGTTIDPDNLPTEWTADGGPYYVVGPITIPADQTITINPNVTVNIATPDTITVLGCLQANRAVFKSVWDDTLWGGIKLAGNSRTNSTISDCLIQNALTPLEIQGGDPIITGNTLAAADSTYLVPGTGIKVIGDANPNIHNLLITNYSTGISMHGNAERVASASTSLSNVRIRNTTSVMRPITQAMVIFDVSRINLNQVEIEGFTQGILVAVSDRATSQVSLSNVRIRNTTSVLRPVSAALSFGSGVFGKVHNCRIENAPNGIVLDEGSSIEVKGNIFLNCGTGILSSASVTAPQIKQNLFKLENSFVAGHSEWTFSALSLSLAGPHEISQNTFYGYPRALEAVDANVVFKNNIVWNPLPLATPFSLQSSSLINSYNDIRYSLGSYPGLGNINADPMFMSVAQSDFSLNFNSPCIDSGDPDQPDTDGTVADMGAFSYLHRADFDSSVHFVAVGENLVLENLSLGHDSLESLTQWDLNNDGSIESTERNFTHSFSQPGFYDLRLTQQTGNLIDRKIAYGVIVVQAENYLPPQNLQLQRLGANIRLSWQPVTQNTQHQPLQNPVNYYLIYQSDYPYGEYGYAGYTEGGITHWQTPSQGRQFFFVMAFSGSREQLQRIIQSKHKLMRVE
jgi:hypothetical protein